MPRLQLASTATVADGREGAKKNPLQASTSEEIDELDEFDSQLPIQLDRKPPTRTYPLILW